MSSAHFSTATVTASANKIFACSARQAVEACRGRHEGQKCYICLEAVHPRTGEGLVRGCACGDRDGVASGRTGIAHVSCLVEQAKILCDEAEENNLGDEMFYERFNRWDTCSLCKQGYHGVVHCALGWGCWKTYVRRPEGHALRCVSIGNLGNGLSGADQHEDALTVRETHVSMLKHFDRLPHFILVFFQLTHLGMKIFDLMLDAFKE